MPERGLTARFIVADVFDGLATLEAGSVDLVVTSPPFLALRSYLPADHPDKNKEIGSEATPAEFIDVMLRVTAELRRVLAPHGSICVELGDTYAGSGGGGGDYLPGGMREGQQQFAGSDASMRESNAAHWRQKNSARRNRPADVAAGILPPTKRPGPKERDNIAGWPLAKSKTLIPELYRIALAYGINPLTGAESPAGRWRVRNVVTWARPNPPVGALGDKWRPATSDLVVACTSPKRYWDDLATRKPLVDSPGNRYVRKVSALDSERRPDGSQAESTDNRITKDYDPSKSSGAPLLDYWEIPPGGYKGSHYAVFPPELVEPCVKAMCPPKVCRTCGEPSRRITETEYVPANHGGSSLGVISTSEKQDERESGDNGSPGFRAKLSTQSTTLGWTDCGHDNYRPGLILDPFAGSGTTLAVTTGYGHDAIGIDLDHRNVALARDRVGPFLFELVENETRTETNRPSNPLLAQGPEGGR